MFDLKIETAAPKQLSSNTNRKRTNSISQQISLPIFFSSNNISSKNDGVKNSQSIRQWIGRCPRDPPRHFNFCDMPNNSHRSSLSYELENSYLRPISPLLAPLKTKRQRPKNNYKESAKATGATSVLSLSNNEEQNFDRYDASSKQFTIKAESIRSVNNVVNDTNSSLPSLSKYLNPEKREKHNNELDPNLYLLKREQPFFIRTRFNSIEGSLYGSNSDYNSTCRTPLTPPSSCTPTKLSSPTIPDNQTFSIKSEIRVSLPSLSSPSQMNAPLDKYSPMNILEPIQETSLLSFQYEQPVDTLNTKQRENQFNILTTKIYKFPLPSAKPKKNKILSKRGSHLQVWEKMPAFPTTLFSKEEFETSTSLMAAPTQKKRSFLTESWNKSKQPAINYQHSSSTRFFNTTKSKYELLRWYEPYVGLRLDPPTPPCTPSMNVYYEDSEPNEFRIPFEQSSIIEN